LTVSKKDRTWKIFVSARHALPDGRLPPTPPGECKNPDHVFVCTRAQLAPGVSVEPILLRAVRFAKDATPGQMFYLDQAKSLSEGRRPAASEVPLMIRGRRVTCPFFVGYDAMTPEQRADEARKDRQHLMLVNEELARACYTLHNPTQGKDCLVMVLDCRDSAGAAFAREHYGEEECRRILDRYRERRLIPTITLTIPLATARKTLADKSANASTVLASPLPDGYFRVLAVAAEGFLWGALAADGPMTPKPQTDFGGKS
jgi:hypothetical protein